MVIQHRSTPPRDRNRLAAAATAALCAALAPRAAAATTYPVGPTQAHRSPCALFNDRAVTLAAGDVIVVDAGTYTEACIVRASGAAGNPITLRGAPGARPVMDGAGMDLSGSGSVPRAVLQFSGASNWVVEHLELRNANNGTNNAAGVRLTGMSRDVTLRDLSLHDNNNGLFSDSSAVLTLESSEVFNNGARDGQSHNMYLNGESARLVGNYVHDSRGGQNFKSRMHYVELLYNVFEHAGNYEIDFIQGGADTDRADSNVVMVGNLLVRDAAADNHGQTILFGTDNPGEMGRNGSFYAFNNTFVLTHASNRLVRALNPRAGARIYFSNNVVHTTVAGVALGNDATTDALFTGSNNWTTTGVGAPAGLTAGLTGAAPGFVSATDFHLAAGSPVIDRGAAGMTFRDGAGAMQPGLPTRQFLAPAGTSARPVVGATDLGAFEFGAATMGDAGAPDAAVVDAAVTDVAVPPRDSGGSDVAASDVAASDVAVTPRDSGGAPDVAAPRADGSTTTGPDGGTGRSIGGCGCRTAGDATAVPPRRGLALGGLFALGIAAARARRRRRSGR